MASSFAAIFANVVISNVMGSIMSNLLQHTGQKQDGNTLQKFLNTLSKDFEHRVENIVRAAFSEQNFLLMKTNVFTAATAFRSFTASQGKDTFYLNNASESILAARSLFFAETQALIGRVTNPSTIDVADPIQKGKTVNQLLASIKAALSAQQAIVGLDLIILAKRVEYFPELKQEIVDRTNEYLEQADLLKIVYQSTQSFRNFVKFKRVFLPDIPNIFPGADQGQRCRWLTSICYHDGQEVNKNDKREILRSGDSIDLNTEIRRSFEQISESLIDKRNTEDFAEAERYLKSAGNIEEAIKAWQEVKKIYS